MLPSLAAAQAPDAPPVPVIAPLAPAECEAGRGTVTLDGRGSSDPDGDAIGFHWSAPGATFVDPSSPLTTGSFPLGTTTVTLAVSARGVIAKERATVEVVDTTPPVVLIERPARGHVYVLDEERRHGLGLGAVAVGPVTVVARATDACGVAKVAFATSHGESGEDATPPFTFRTDPPVGGPRNVEVVATALDVVGLTGSRAKQFVHVGTECPVPPTRPACLPSGSE